MLKYVFRKQIKVGALLLQLVLGFVIWSPGWAQNLPNAPSAQKTKTQSTQTKESGWPRTFTNGADEFLVYQPEHLTSLPEFAANVRITTQSEA